MSYFIVLAQFIGLADVYCLQRAERLPRQKCEILPCFLMLRLHAFSAAQMRARNTHF
jgi:hypothetical protein